MKKLHSNTLAKVALARIAGVGLSRASPRDVESVALGVWHKGFMPKAAELAGVHRSDASYLIDRLARFNIVPVAQKKRMLKALGALKPTQYVTIKAKKLRDPLANAWQAGMDYTPFKDRLLPLQTRHFRQIK